jgi:hypothetical protein
MSKDPAVLFYTGDFLVGTMKMNYAQKGKYIQLLCLQHQDGHLSEDDMLSVCGDYDEKIFSKFIKDDNGRYYNERMEVESVKRRRFVESRQRNLVKTDKEAQVEEHKERHMEAHMENHTESRMENENRNRNKDDNNIKNKKFNINIIEKEFEEIWLLYPNKKGKSSALTHYKKARKNGVEFEIIKQKVMDYALECDLKKREKDYIAHGSTWFSQSRWADDYDLTIPREEENGNGFDDWAKRLIGG